MPHGGSATDMMPTPLLLIKLIPVPRKAAMTSSSSRSSSSRDIRGTMDIRDYFGFKPRKQLLLRGDFLVSRAIVIGSSHCRPFINEPLAGDVAVAAIPGGSLGHCIEVD